MARPQAEILLSTQETDLLGWDILTAPGSWIVLYKDQPFNVRQRHWTGLGEKPKYLRTSYSNQAPATNLAEKLNQLFYTKEFTVKKIL
jgi:hypothetical protein